MNLNENSYWLGAKRFVEAPKDAKWNITFTKDASSDLPQLDLDRDYAFYSQSLYSSPSGCTGIEPDVSVYANRVEDGAVTIFAKPHYNGVIIFSGVRHSHSIRTADYSSYASFLENLVEKSK